VGTSTKALSLDGKGKWAEAFKASRALLVWAFIFGAGVNVLYLAPSLFMMQVYDRVLQTGGLGTLWFVKARPAACAGAFASGAAARDAARGRAPASNARVR
jgi:ATP-binding cassette subfamily C protein